MIAISVKNNTVYPVGSTLQGVQPSFASRTRATPTLAFLVTPPHPCGWPQSGARVAVAVAVAYMTSFTPNNTAYRSIQTSPRDLNPTHTPQADTSDHVLHRSSSLNLQSCPGTQELPTFTYHALVALVEVVVFPASLTPTISLSLYPLDQGFKRSWGQHHLRVQVQVLPSSGCSNQRVIKRTTGHQCQRLRQSMTFPVSASQRRLPCSSGMLQIFTLTFGCFFIVFSSSVVLFIHLLLSCLFLCLFHVYHD